jgi:hypothetical protein
MTDLKRRFAELVDAAPSDGASIDRVVTEGRRALRRRSLTVAAVGTAGTAAVTAAVVVPITTGLGHGSNHDSVVIAGTSPSPTPSHCRASYLISKGTGLAGKRKFKQELSHAVDRMGTKRYQVRNLKHGVAMVSSRGCATPQPTPGKPTPATSPTPTSPPYRYHESAKKISQRLAQHLSGAITDLGFTIVYQRPFAQETSTLEHGHPSYFDGNDDVKVGSGLGDIGMQVTHETTVLDPFDGPCPPRTCTETKLPDGSVERTDQVTTGTGGGTVLTVDVHRPNGLDVRAQESNYAFGPEATKAHGKQPLTLGQLRTLAEDPAFAF